MTVKPEPYARKPFYVTAVQVTKDNINDVAEWCKGNIQSLGEEGEGKSYIKVRAHRPLNDRQTQAFPGDWVVFSGSTFKVYTPKAFQNSFQKADGIDAKNALAHLQAAVDKPVVANVGGQKVHLRSVKNEES